MDLLPILRQIAKNQSVIKLMSIYKGLPISYDSHVTSVGESQIQVDGNRSQIACLYYQGEAYLQAAELPVVIRSDVKSLNLAQNYAVLANFELAPFNIGKRMQIRVEPDDPLVVAVQFTGSSFEFVAPLADISANGASFFFDDYIFPTRLARPGNELTISISIPDFVARKMKKPVQRPNERRNVVTPLRVTPPVRQEGDISIVASGKIVKVHPDAELNRYRVSAHVYFKDMSRMVILQYISHRQSEIIKELRVLSEELYNIKNK